MVDEVVFGLDYDLVRVDKINAAPAMKEDLWAIRVPLTFI